MDATALVSAERADFAAFCRTLSDEEWTSPSLCEGWRVRDVVAHVIQVDDDRLRDHVLGFVRAGFSPDRFNARGVAKRARWTTARLTDTLARQAEVGRLSRVRHGIPAFVDALIHHQDVRRPLGKPRVIPTERLRVALNAPDPFTGAGRRAKGLSFVATDVDWSRGEGPEVRGPGEAIVMAVAGRRDALKELAGEGVATLAQRL